MMSAATFNHRWVQANGVRLHFVDEGPANAHTIVFLVHGFPDIWYSWRYIIAALARQGYRVIVPSLRGYGLSDFPYAPIGDQKALETYSTKTLCTDLFDLCSQVTAATASSSLPGKRRNRIVWVGHDWGSYVVWRMHLHFPAVVDAVASLCVPYSPPHKAYLSTTDLVKQLPHFYYQLVFEQQPIESAYDKNVRKVLQLLFQPHTSPPRVDLASLSKISDQDAEEFARTCLLSEQDLDYYVASFERTGFHGGLNGYRVREINYRDELPFTTSHEAKSVHVPALMITVGHDPTFPPTMGKSMPAFIPRLTRKHIELASHWVQQEQPDDVARYLLDWLLELSKLWGGSIYKEKPKL